MAAPANPQKKTILIVDSAERTEEISKFLAQKYEGSTFYFAREASEAFQKIHNVPPTIVITELEYPKSNALTLLERVRKTEALEKIPFLLMTKRPREDELVQKCTEKNAVYIAKPFDLQFLFGLVEGIFASSRPVLRELRFATDEIVFKEGDPAGSLYLIKNGSLEISKSVAAKKIILTTLKAGEIVGEMAFLDKKPRSATATASTDTTLVELPIRDLETYLHSQPVWLKSILTTILVRLRGANETISKLTNNH